MPVPPRHREVQKWRIDLWSFLMLRSRFEAVGNKSTDQFLEFEHLKFSVHSFFATHARFWYAPLWSARGRPKVGIESKNHDFLGVFSIEFIMGKSSIPTLRRPKITENEKFSNRSKNPFSTLLELPENGFLGP